jgi:germacradienol/geosmin synthase
MRRKTFGADLTMSLSRLSLGQNLPPEIYNTRTMRGLDNSTADYACFTNDIFSYQKEIEFEGEINNCVLVVQKFLDCDPPKAVEVVNDLMTSRMRQFEHIVATEIPVLDDEFHLDASACKALRAYVEKLQRYMCGVLRWHMAVDRYKEFELRDSSLEKRLLSGPTGLGTSAARLSSLVGTEGLSSALGQVGSDSKEFELRNSSPEKRLLSGPTGLGTSATRLSSLVGTEGLSSALGQVGLDSLVGE